MTDKPLADLIASNTRKTPRPDGTGQFPATRMRRNRRADWSRRLVRETTLTPADLIWPLFVMEGRDEQQAIPAMPGVYRLTIDRVVKAAREAADLAIPAVAIFPYTDPALRDATGSQALNPDNLVCRTVRAIREAGIAIGVLCDAALDPYTDHGHDGLLRDGQIVNDATLEVLVRQALVQTEAGCDIIAPSDMMDGRVGAIRQALEEAGHHDTQIMSYAAKYASAFYGPFRDAVGSSKTLTGDKRTYQMDPGNSDEAIREVALDIAEGADMVMVKPGMAYLDILTRVRRELRVPTFAYQVSGEYAMLTMAAEQGCFDKQAIMFEALTAFKRAGANGVLTYFARDAARLLNA